MAYQFAAGYNNTGSLANIVPQPNTPGYTWPAYIDATDGSGFNDGFGMTDLTFTLLQISEWIALNTQLGLTDASPSAQGTFRLKDAPSRAFHNYNGIIKRPNAVWKFNLPANVFVYRLVNLR